MPVSGLGNGKALTENISYQRRRRECEASKARFLVKIIETKTPNGNTAERMYC